MIKGIPFHNDKGYGFLKKCTYFSFYLILQIDNDYILERVAVQREGITYLRTYQC